MPWTYLAEVEGVSEVRARVDLLCQVLHEEVKEERVGISVQHSDSFTEGVFQERVESVPKTNIKCDRKNVNVMGSTIRINTPAI